MSITLSIFCIAHIANSTYIFRLNFIYLFYTIFAYGVQTTAKFNTFLMASHTFSMDGLLILHKVYG